MKPDPSSEVSLPAAADLDATIRVDVRATLPVGIEQPGDMIGRYRLIEPLGQGGFGSVWRAEQHMPIHREVALKVIKPGMDSREIIARFEAERQALALMDHPNIAAVLDAGTTESGRPFFAMELVKGVPITDYCDAKRLGIRQRLELFIPVCQAVQHAHQKAILHRDLKPSNILVMEVDGKAVPKVIDFGIAKALRDTNEAVLHTSLAQTIEGIIVGTPQYMSPEQAGSVPDVDTRSDIYTLGVILYELLVGVTPLGREQMKQAAMDEVFRSIRESEPRRPSSKVTPATELAAKTASLRQSEPRKLGHALRGDLDWIVLKALEKDRARRYDTANAFALDLRRHLASEPVSAGPPSRVYRLRKMVARNKLVFAAIAAVSLSLIVGVTFSTLSFIREKAARQRAEFAERETEAALRKEAAQRLAAQIQAEAAISKNVAAAKPIEALARAFWAVARSAEAGHSVPPVPVNSLVNALLHARQRWVAATPLVTALAVDAEHTLCAVGCAAGDLEIHEMATGKRLQRKGVAHRGDTIAVAFFPDGQSLATGGEDGFIRLWTHRLDPVHEGWLAHPGWVKALAVSADGLHLLSIGGEGALKCWDATQPGKLLWTHQLPCGQVTAANFDRMGGKVIVQSANLFDLAAYVATCGSPDGTVQRLVFGDSPLSAIALSADGTRAALGTSEGTVQLWRTADAIRLGTFQTCNSKITALAFHDDNQALSSMADDHLWRVFSLDGKEMQPPAPGGSTPLAFFGGISPGLLHTNRQGGNVILKDVGDLLAAPSFNVGADLKGIVWSPDGRLIASVDGARQLNVWEAANGQPLGQTRCSAAGIFPKIAASPDGSLLATISNGESLVRFWTWEGQPAAEVPQITLPNGCGAGLIWHPQRQELWVGTTTGHLYSLSHTAGSQARLLHSLNIPGGGLGIASLTLVGEHIVTLWGCSGDGERQVRSKAWLTAFALDGRLAVEEPLNTERILDSWGTYTIIAPIGAPGEFLEASQLQNDALVVRRHRLGATDITELSSFRMFAQTDKGYWSATPRGSLVAAVTSSRGISLLDISGVAITPPFLLGRKGIGTPSFDPAGKRIAVGGRTGWIYICHAGLAAWTKLAVDKLRSDMSWQQEALDAAVKTDLQRLLANPPAMHGIPISP